MIGRIDCVQDLSDVNIDRHTREYVPGGLGRMDGRSLLARVVVLIILPV